MIRYLIKRILEIIPTLFIVVTMAFLLTRVIPGDPVLAACGEQASPEVIQKVTREMGLDKPIWEQYKTYMGNVLRGDLGKSIAYNKPVMALIAEKIPFTLQITLSALVLALILGLLIGIYSATHPYSFGDYLFTFLALVGISIPTFWLALMLVLLFSVQLGLLPAFGVGEPGFVSMITHRILPIVVLSLSPLTIFTRITRSSMMEVVNKDYIKALRARGMGEKVVIYKHALKNALAPIVTVLGMQLAAAFTGAILTESIFSWPGMGTLIISAIDNRDYAQIQGSVLFIALVYIIINLIVDITYSFINPKHRSSISR